MKVWLAIRSVRPVRRRRLHRHAATLEPLEPGLALDARLLITEVVADNEGGLQDEDGDRSDWIEIHNAGDVTVNLAVWHLTDSARNPNKWQFPALELAPQHYLLVFASGKNRVTPGSPLHTNFKLAAEGEYLALIQPDGTAIGLGMTTPGFPAMRADTSYGLVQPSHVDQLLATEFDVRALLPNEQQ